MLMLYFFKLLDANMLLSVAVHMLNGLNLQTASPPALRIESTFDLRFLSRVLDPDVCLKHKLSEDSPVMLTEQKNRY